MSHMLVLGDCWHRPILGEESLFERKPILGRKKYIFGQGLFLERKIYFWSTCHRWWKRNMPKKKEKQHEEGGKEACFPCSQT
jgi:hypothetical protein